MSFVYIAILVLSLLADRLSKHWAQTTLLELGGSLPLWKGVFHFTYVENRGAAFGMFQGGRVVFLVLTAVVVLALLWRLFLAKKKVAPFVGVSLSLVLAGALGNMIDRLAYGYVVDMLDFCLIRFAVFNVADSCVVVGVVLLCVWILFIDGRKGAHKPLPAPDSSIGGEGQPEGKGTKPEGDNGNPA